MHTDAPAILYTICCRVKMKQAYDFALEHVGIDFHSTTLWTDYIAFLKSEYVICINSCTQLPTPTSNVFSTHE